VPVQSGRARGGGQDAFDIPRRAVEWRPERLRHGRLQAAARPGIIGVHPPTVTRRGSCRNGDRNLLLPSRSAAARFRAQAAAPTSVRYLDDPDSLLVKSPMRRALVCTDRRAARAVSYCDQTCSSAIGDLRASLSGHRNTGTDVEPLLAPESEPQRTREGRRGSVTLRHDPPSGYRFWRVTPMMPGARPPAIAVAETLWPP